MSLPRQCGSGAYDYHQKPVNIEELKIVLKRACYLSDLEQHITELREVISEKTQFEGMVAISRSMMDLFERAKSVARTDYPILIQGQSGTGKERLAQAIHALSDRAEKPFIIVDCGAIPENLLESELFGHEKGSFTGAHARQIGKLERAQQGTVVLDEIGELPAPSPGKTPEIPPGGDHRTDRRQGAYQRGCSGHRDHQCRLSRAVKENLFREDLYYRLNVVPLMVPTLKERPEDIPVLAKYFLETYSQEIGPKFKGFSPEAMDAMTSYDWPGNVREMQNRIRRGVVMAEGDFIEPSDIDLQASGQEIKTLKQLRDEAEIKAISRPLPGTITTSRVLRTSWISAGRPCTIS